MKAERAREDRKIKTKTWAALEGSKSAGTVSEELLPTVLAVLDSVRQAQDKRKGLMEVPRSAASQRFLLPT